MPMRHGLTDDEFDAWKAHPTTPKVLRYLFDLRASLMEAWAEGGIATDAWPEYQAHCALLKQLSEIDFETIDQFYHPPTEAADETR
jgi:hypothetical protein